VADTPISVPIGSLTLTGEDKIFYNSGDMRLILDGLQPNVRIGPPQPSAGSLALTGETPTRGTGLITIGQQPTARIDEIVPAIVGTAQFSSTAPQVLKTVSTVIIIPSPGAIAVTEETPLVLRVFPSIGQIQLTGIAPDGVLQEPPTTRLPATRALDLTGLQPVVPIEHPASDALSFSSSAPELIKTGQSEIAAPETRALNLSSDAPVIDRGITSTAGSISLSGILPGAIVDDLVIIPVFYDPVTEGETENIKFGSTAPTTSIEFVGGIENLDATPEVSHYLICDRTGTRIKVKKGLVEDGYGSWVRHESAEPRHPSERVRSKKENFRQGAIRPEIVKPEDMTFIQDDDPVLPEDL
jgi:hypothetical protein